MPLREWTHNNSRYTSRYYCSYCFRKWNTCLERGLLDFTSPYLTTNGHLLNFDGCHHYWLDLHIYGATNIDDDNACDDGYSKEDMIICWTSTKWWFHSFYYWNMWLFSLSFWFIFDRLCINNYCVSLTIFFSFLNACFLLLTMHIHSLTTCASHNDSLTCYYIWSRFLISFIHIANAPLSLANLKWMPICDKW
jgi:hypothetical protein